MAEPKVCVSLEAITVEEMIDEATRANIAGADYVEVSFDRLYLNKPEPVTMVNNEQRSAVCTCSQNIVANIISCIITSY